MYSLSSSTNNRVDLTQNIQHQRLPHLLPPPRQQERSQQSKAHQLSLLTLLEEPQPALRMEAVPVELTLGVEPRFWLVHQESGLRVPGQFSGQEAEHILKTTEHWGWDIEYRPRTPNCSHRLFCLLSTLCTLQSLLRCAV